MADLLLLILPRLQLCRAQLLLLFRVSAVIARKHADRAVFDLDHLRHNAVKKVTVV